MWITATHSRHIAPVPAGKPGEFWRSLASSNHSTNVEETGQDWEDFGG